MGMKMSDARFLVVLMTVSLGMVMLSQDVVGDDAVYACLGGCYNKCFILSKQPPFETLVCFFKCFLTDCVSSGPPPANFVDSCGVGCSMEFCPLQSLDEATLGQCIGSCGDMCELLKSLGTTQQQT
ncbi:PREDICTED: uncharacterized protein LOC109154297 [Ipomoea nil]|uniref:uncharacterized protein LOC109154297 n=1 Tax=Ipomoea nil TaxID=35883 RepID=UPI00090097F0|nr:PREDICTED: uncharacterized protein LOC109154297 [Ipomoea nil]